MANRYLARLLHLFVLSLFLGCGKEASKGTSTFPPMIRLDPKSEAVEVAWLGDCESSFLNTLKTRYPKGYSVWSSLSKENQAILANLIICRDDRKISVSTFSTFVHEAIHLLDRSCTVEKGPVSYLRITGQWVGSYYFLKDSEHSVARGQALSAMTEDERRSNRAELYLFRYGYATFFDLLDELNAYNFGLHTALAFPEVHSFEDVGDAPLEFVFFALRYLEAMENSDRVYYRELLEIGTRRILFTSLISDAYAVTNSACNHPEFFNNIGRIFDALDTPASQRQLKAIFGTRVPVLSPDCRKNERRDSFQKKATPVDFPKERSAS